MHYICVWHANSIYLSKVTNIEVIRQNAFVMQEFLLLVLVVTLNMSFYIGWDWVEFWRVFSEPYDINKAI